MSVQEIKRQAMNTTALTILKGVPFPVRKRTVSRWSVLEVGDAAPVSHDYDRCNALAWARRNGRKFVGAKAEGGNGYLVWRVE